MHDLHQEFDRRLDRLENDLAALKLRFDRIDLQELLRYAKIQNERMEQLMALSQEMRDLITKLNTRTNEMSEDLGAVQTRIQMILDQIVGGISATEAAEIKAGLQAAVDSLDPVAASLDAMGKVVDNPIPPAP